MHAVIHMDVNRCIRIQYMYTCMYVRGGYRILKRGGGPANC